MLNFADCKDIRSDCHDYPDSSCQDPYRQWAKDNCPNRCGICLGKVDVFVFLLHMKLTVKQRVFCKPFHVPTSEN